jgi:hypothetical protein
MGFGEAAAKEAAEAKMAATKNLEYMVKLYERRRTKGSGRRKKK